jgi:hypothetical protein
LELDSHQAIHHLDSHMVNERLPQVSDSKSNLTAESLSTRAKTNTFTPLPDHADAAQSRSDARTFAVTHLGFRNSKLALRMVNLSAQTKD